MDKSRLNILVLAVVPLLLYGLGEWQRQVAGPYHLGPNQDPSYMYLHNGLNLAVGLPVWHVDNPGTPLQVVCAVVERAHYAFFGDDSVGLQRHVLEHADQVLTGVNRLLMLALALSVLALGLHIWRRHRSIGAALLVQGLIVGFTVQIMETQRIRPEPVILIVCCWLAIALLPRLKPGEAYDLSPLRSLAVGALIGLAVACKFTALPLCLLAFASPSWRRNLLSVGGAIAAFFLAILPARATWPRMLDWFLGLLTRSGNYGEGEEGIPGIGSLAASVLELLKGAPVYFLAVAALAVALAWLRLRLRALPPPEPEPAAADSTEVDADSTAGAAAYATIADDPIAQLRLPGLLLIVLLGQIAMVAKHPGLHYLLPSMCAIAIAYASLYRLSDALLPAARRPLTIAAAVLLALMCLKTVVTLAAFARDSARYRQEIAALDQRLAQDYPDALLIEYYAASTQRSAHAFGNDWCGWGHHEILAEMYPKQFYYSIAEEAVSNFAIGRMETNSLIPVLNSGQVVILRGNPLQQKQLDKLIFDVTLVDDQGPEHIYRVNGVRPQRIHIPGLD